MRFSAACAAALCGAAVLTAPAHANLIANGSFELNTLAANNTTKESFAGNVTGWTNGNNLTFIDAPGSADDFAKYLAVYGPFPSTSPNGGDFVEADGAPSYSGSFSQTVSGLTTGKSYTLTFYQAAGQQQGFSGPTTERWSTTLGDPSIAGDVQLSPQFALAGPGGVDVGPWQQVTETFTANAASELLTFLAVGTPNGQPPISFLDGVDLEPASVPEPVTLSLLALGLAGTVVARRRARTA